MIPVVRMYHDGSHVWIALESTLYAATEGGRIFGPQTSGRSMSHEVFRVAIGGGPDQETAVRNARAFARALTQAIDHAEREGWRHE